MEDDIVSGAKVSLLILVMSVFTDWVGKRPGVATLTSLSDPLSLRFLNLFMEANIDESLLIEVLLIDVTH